MQDIEGMVLILGMLLFVAGITRGYCGLHSSPE